MLDRLMRRFHMRLYRVEGKGKFTEYKEQAFKIEHSEETLESWLDANPDAIVEDGPLLIIGRQVTTNLGSIIDLLALDKEGNTAVIEIKRDRTPRETLAQALEYASFVESLEYEQLEQILRDYVSNENESLLEYHRAYFKLDEGEGISFNKNQRVVLVGSGITPQIRQTSVFLRKKGLPVTCVEFNYFKTDSGEQLMSNDIVVGTEPLKTRKISAGSLPRIDKTEFLTSTDKYGRPLFEAILRLTDEHELQVNWGSKGFSLNVNIEGVTIVLIFGYVPSSAFHQTIYTGFYYVAKKVREGSDLVESYRGKFKKTGLFIPAGKEVKFTIQKRLSKEQIKDITKLILDLANDVREKGLVEPAT